MRFWFDSKSVTAIGTLGVTAARIKVSLTCDMEKWHLGGKTMTTVTGSIPVVATKNCNGVRRTSTLNNKTLRAGVYSFGYVQH